MAAESANFDFLKTHDPQLVRLGALAERYFQDDPSTSLIKLRQFAELLAQLAAARTGLYVAAEETQADLLRRLKFERVISQEVAELFYQIRTAAIEQAERYAQGFETGAEVPGPWGDFQVPFIFTPPCHRRRQTDPLA